MNTTTAMSIVGIALLMPVIWLAFVYFLDRQQRAAYIATLSQIDREQLRKFEVSENWRRHRDRRLGPPRPLDPTQPSYS